MKTPFLFSIKTKFVLIAALVVAIFSATWGSGVVREEKTHLFARLENNGRLLMTSLRAPIINTMILGEMGVVPSLLDNFVEEIVKNAEAPTHYAFITDTNGKVLAHNRYDAYGKFYEDPLTRAALAGEAYRSRVVNDGGEDILDMAMPLRVSGKSWGALRIGLSMTPMQNEFLKFKLRVASFSALLFLAGTVTFFMVGRSMSRPLEQLSWAMSDIDLGTFEAKPIAAPRRDEIGILQVSFDEMLMRLRRSEQERQNALNYLIQNEKMATIGKIVAGVAHEVNNPLAAISACIYSLEGGSKDPRNCMEILKAGIVRIETIVHQLSDFSRVGTLELRNVPSDVFFRETEAFAVMAMKKHKTRLIAVDECRPPVVLHIDKGKMHQVALNLLVNATAASPDAGTVELRALVSDGAYLLMVTDKGVGIPDEDRERIFDIFFTTKPAGVGSGIGLAVCKSIVDLHRGTIEVASRPGETTFSVRIPLENGVGNE